MASTIKIDTIESRSANAGLTISGGLNSPTGKPIINKQGQIVGDLILLAMEANTANSVTARIDRISSYQAGNTIMFDSPIYVDYATIRNLNSDANVIASDTTTNNLIATFATLENTTANNLTVTTLVSSDSTFENTSANTIVANTITVLGDLTVEGNVTTLSTQTLLVEDNIVVFGSNNAADITDLGFAGRYSYDNGVTTLYAGIFRDASDGKFYVFKDYPTEPPIATLTGFNTSSMTGTLVTSYSEVLEELITPKVTSPSASDLVVVAPDGDLELTASGEVRIDSYGTGVFINSPTYNVTITGNLLSSGNYDIGSSGSPWGTIHADDVTVENIEANNINATSYTNVDYNNLINKPAITTQEQLQIVADDAFVNSIIFG